MKRHLYLVKSEPKKLTLIEKIKKYFSDEKKKAEKKQVELLEMYYCRLYAYQERNNKLNIPYFVRAIETVKDIKQKGLLNEVYEYVISKSGVC